MENTPRNISTADDLDSTVLRHQVQRYFNELQQDASLSDTPLNMDFLLGQKRKPQASSVVSKPAAQDSLLPKRIRYDVTATSESSEPLPAFARRSVHDSFSHSSMNKSRFDSTSQLEQEFSSKKAQVMNLQQKLIQLEMKLSGAETDKSQLKSNMTHVQDASKLHIQQYKDQIENLKSDIEKLQLKNLDLSTENVQIKESMEEMKVNYANERLVCKQKITSVEQEKEEMQNQLQLEINQLKRNSEVVTWEVEKHKLEAEEAKKLLQLKERVTAPCNHEAVIEQQQQVIQEMENALFSQRTAFSQSHEAKLAKIPQMENELAQLYKVNKLYRETAENELLLKEQISSLQESLRRCKEERQVIPNLECELKKSENRLFEWAALARDLLNVDTLDQVRHKIEDMRKEELKLRDDLGNLTLELNSFNRSNAALKEQMDALKDSNRGKGELEDRVRKLERKLNVVQKDRDHYRTINEMFEREMTHVGAPSMASVESNQIQNLERLLDEYRKLVSYKDSETSRAGDSETVKKLNEEKTQLASQIQQLNQTVESLKAQLEIAASKGVGADTKVLHFTSNPLDNARRLAGEQIVILEKENAALRERVRLMEDGHSQNLTILVGEKFDEGYTPQRFKEMEESLKSNQLKNQRMEEVFHKYCSDFRRGIFHLFGYQVDCDEGNYKLTSVYSEDPQDFLSFKSAGDGLMVMDSPYIHTVDDLVQLHVNRQRSIPAFLAAVTIELFSRQSMNSTSTFTSNLSV